jgi:hypothetical protein
MNIFGRKFDLDTKNTSVGGNQVGNSKCDLIVPPKRL